jgi:ERCC4-related helicase
MFEKNTTVHHCRFGRGSVRSDEGATVLVRFEHGLEECLPRDLEVLEGIGDRAKTGSLDPAVNVVAKILGNCILSVNDAWGVFSRSRIALLPHQLWVCKRVLETWPTRWLVADDVGLGKTIEAGLILTPLLSSGRVRRLLILAPASLVDQWQLRLREMFDIRLSSYSPSNDTKTSDYWNTHDRIVASAHTLRLDTSGRWDRLLESNPWDLVLVDEAHHMNVNEEGGRTLAFQLMERLQERSLVRSMVLFTGTPHRGKDYGFLSLLKLLRPNEFDPQSPLEDQVRKLRTVMIRNNKHRVTDMKGNPLFTPVIPHRETCVYSREEAKFYSTLTEFVATGKAYAAGLGQKQQRMAILVLITMQKLASSSVAAVRNALANRLSRLKNAQEAVKQCEEDFERIEQLRKEDDHSNLDEIARYEERMAETVGNALRLNANEIPTLEELILMADEVRQEAKITRIFEVIEESFPRQSVLLFTEYKATQAMLMSALQARYGDGCVAFINGDGRADGVKDASGVAATISEDRERAAERFNRGEVRFLVSTEAAGEGIDLQGNCSALVHVDLPWNPMRLHQRVGRLSRYGQANPVHVVTVRNPDTVEGRIWECLDQKLDRITLAFQGAMDDPEDMRELVIGMTSPRMFDDLFAGADPDLRGERLEQWFNAKTATFGGEQAVGVVRGLFGNVARFDFGEVADQIPKVDLPDMVPFVKTVFAMLGKRPHQADDVRLSFKTPQQWMDDFAIVEEYKLAFTRGSRLGDGEDIAGVGLRVVDRALRTAVDAPESLSAIGELEGELVVFAIRDRITGAEAVVRRVIVGLQHCKDSTWKLLLDWQLLKLLNPIADKPRSAVFDVQPQGGLDVRSLLVDAERELGTRLNEIDLPFQLPEIECIACLMPSRQETGQDQEGPL